MQKEKKTAIKWSSTKKVTISHATMAGSIRVTMNN